ncbi:MAG: DUF4348 domain-containing protein [Saprospiraceae bacterium]|nr:DUF4348 domain-containing protein [Saprospiraceae bacterium]MDW8483186.1 DUF4348 domain-containing protein [Saprospiraceae bacterium]
MRSSLFWSLLLLCFAACRERQSAPPIASPLEGKDIPADFVAFYQKFHADSVFQVQHISWPLAGLTTEPAPDGTLSSKPIYWERENWRFQRAVDFSKGEFKQHLHALEGRYVVEVIAYAAASHYALERRFMRRSDGSWELVYYADMQER